MVDIISIAEYVTNAIRAAVGNCIIGVSIGDPNNKGTWIVDYIDSVTEQQIAASQSVIMALNYDEYVQSILNRSDAFEIDVSRTEILSKLRDLSPDELEAFVRVRLNADAVTNLASAILFCKRVETAIAQIVKIMARGVKDNPIV